MQLLCVLLFPLLLSRSSWAVHPPSPCPDVFGYEGSEPENNKWYGEISLRTDENLLGIRLDIELDRPSDLMVSWMGDITTDDNVKFTVLNLNQRLRPGPPVLSRIMVKFNRTTGSPKVRFIRLNGRKICPEDSAYTVESDQVTGPIKRPTTRRPDPEFHGGQGSAVHEYPVNGNVNNNNNNDNDNNNNNNNRPGSHSNNNNNVDENNSNNNNNSPNTDYSSSYSVNSRPQGGGYNSRPVTSTTEDPSATRRTTKATTRNPYEGNANNKPNNNPNTVSLQASTDSNSELTGVINGLLQSPKKNKTVIITVIDNNQPNSQEQQQNRPGSGGNSRPVIVENHNNPGNSRPNPVNRPAGQQSTNQRPNNSNNNNYSNNNNNNNNNNNQGEGNSYSGNVNSQQLSAGSCGEVKLAVPLVTSGQSTHRGQWPWHVALYLVDGINLSYHCGGSLVSKNKVITAAHCVTSKQNDAVFNSNKLVIYLGKYHQLQYSNELGIQTKHVIRINVFPSYNSSNYLGDIAVLTLSSDAELTNFVTPVCLWNENSVDLSEIEGKEGTVVGWGFDENDTPTEELKMAKMPVVSHETCLWSYPKFYSEFTSDNTFCAGFRNGTGVCNGDSGGGMVFNINSRWYLRGIVSITVAKEGLRVCDTKHYVVFTDVAKYSDFIRRNLG